MPFLKHPHFLLDGITSLSGFCVGSTDGKTPISLHLSRVRYLISIGQNGKNSFDVDSYFVVNAYVLILLNVVESVKSSG